MLRNYHKPIFYKNSTYAVEYVEHLCMSMI